MTVEERKKIRLDTYNGMLMMVQILPIWQTFGSFENEFKVRMIEKTGEYTAEDEQWVYESLERFQKKNEG